MQVTDQSMPVAGRRTLTWRRVVNRGWDGKVVEDYLTGGAIDGVH
jgi:hypothetical protein